MQSDVFISHSSKDKTTADAICHHLESNGIRCWIAPRDIEFGSDWTEGIMQGITSCRVFVLVFSEHANNSEHVRREVVKAFSLGLAVIPFRIEAVLPNRSLSYFLESVHWLDAMAPPAQKHFNALTDQVKRLLEENTGTVIGATEARPEPDAQLIQPIPPAPPKQALAAGGFASKASTERRSLLKFNLALVPILIAGVCASAAIIRDKLRDGAEQEVLKNANLMLETARASRVYTTEQVAPLLERQQAEIDKSTQVVRQTLEALGKVRDRTEKQNLIDALHRIAGITNDESLPERQFYPQSIPFYAATEAFNYFQRAHPDYAYKEATLNPTNPRDRTVDWEADVVSVFRKDSSKTELTGRRDTPIGPSLFVSAPIKTEKSCLECHSTPDKAPAGMIKLYGSTNGFGWKEGEVVGAQIVSVPATISEKIADTTFLAILAWLIGITAMVFVLVNLAVYFFLDRSTRPDLPLK
jgi:hypothetical protein